MDESIDLNLLSYKLERLYRERDPKYAAVRVECTPPLFNSPILGVSELTLIAAMQRRGLTICKAHRSNDALIYESGKPVDGALLPVKLIL